jgi:SAM-dependent methyltransferase
VTNQTYIGQELDIFAHAVRWKRYWSSVVRPYLHGDVLEVGAGIGTNTRLLGPAAAKSWTCLEPDAQLAERARATLSGSPETARCSVEVGVTATLPANRQFDALLYIDVLEHIEHDKEELERAAGLLRQGGNLVVLSPAHQWLYTPFDQAIGHFRRYDRTSLKACGPRACKLRKLWYLDAAGMLASSGNRLFLQQASPQLSQILFWDRYLVPVSTLLDRMFAHRVGKSILGVWTKQ